jgi:hypothetical protein
MSFALATRFIVQSFATWRKTTFSQRGIGLKNKLPIQAGSLNLEIHAATVARKQL